MKLLPRLLWNSGSRQIGDMCMVDTMRAAAAQCTIENVLYTSRSSTLNLTEIQNEWWNEMQRMQWHLFCRYVIYYCWQPDESAMDFQVESRYWFYAQGHWNEISARVLKVEAQLNAQLKTVSTHPEAHTQSHWNSKRVMEYIGCNGTCLADNALLMNTWLNRNGCSIRVTILILRSRALKWYFGPSARSRSSSSMQCTINNVLYTSMSSLLKLTEILNE